MTNLKLAVLMAAILGAGALFGFYFTMSVSIMPGLDLTQIYAAIKANRDIGRATQQSLWLGSQPSLEQILHLARKPKWLGERRQNLPLNRAAQCCASSPHRCHSPPMQ
ncbi:hypothetical protein [uncultured Roseobacter sp.]|uniref:hypothetical protein n=1 Tax=uncultured Roseobacter sp. TaxID=114847 RepID=UPI00260B6329|nr:hypothetical protein [uncultured Roseobacter sp.]